MTNKKAWKLLIFATAVGMLLLRPYLIYQMTGEAVPGSNPAKTYSLLQRLIKKKDEHHDVRNDALAESRRSRFCFQLPLKVRQKAYPGLLLMSRARLFTPGALANTIFRVRPENHRYRILSCFQV